MTPAIDPSAVLCYVRGRQAFFTTKPLAEQWGDDWNDAPYEHNAGDPYGPFIRLRYGKPDAEQPDYNADGTPKWIVFSVYFDADMDSPDCGCTNSCYSVEQINRGDIAWLRPCIGKGSPIHAGTTYGEFCDRIEEIGGVVYEPRTKGDKP